MTKDDKIHKLTQHIAENTDLDDLIECCYNVQIDYLSELDDEEFEEELVINDIGFDEEGNLIENYCYEEDDE
jgi:hypothetical protein